jgi:hypothetical protein
LQNIINLIRSLHPQHANVSITKAAYLWWIFQDGRSKCPLDNPDTDDLITDSIWFPELKTFLRSNRLRLNLNIPFPPLQREKDNYIMDVVLSHGFTKKIISNINRCRLFLNALTLSDIVNVEGTYIEFWCVDFKSAQPITLPSTFSQYKKPNKSVWHYWKKFITIITNYNSRRLKIPLGNWICATSDIRRQYKTYRTQDHVYTQRQDTIMKQNIQDGSQEISTHIPEISIPCIQSFNILLPQTFKRSIISEDMTNQEKSTSIPQLPESVIICTDASVHEDISAIAWVVTDDTGKVIYQQHQRLPFKSLSSFRAEAYGVFSALTTLYTEILQYKSKWKLYCDNQALIFRLQSMQLNIYNPEWIDSDVLHSIQEHIPPQGEFYHVKGHQILTNTSSISAKLNHYVDKIANLAITEDPKELVLTQPTRVKSDRGPLFSTSQIIQHCRTQVSHAFWTLRLGLQVYNITDWQIYENLSITFKDQVSIIKLFNGLTPTKKRLYKLSQSDSQMCPLCTTQEEDFHHVGFCSHNPERISTHIDDISKSLTKYGDLTKFVQTFIFNLEHKTAENTDMAQVSQHQLGWHEILRGKTSLDFRSYVTPLLKKEKTQVKFILHFLTLLISQWKRAWLHRIRQVATNTVNNVQDISHQANMKKLQTLYAQKQYISAINQRYMCDSLNTHMNQTPMQITTWINLHYESILRTIPYHDSHNNSTPTS